jgi:hypothetical protein
MFGSGDTQAQTQTVASGVNIQSSCYGNVVPVIYGQARVTGNLVWYGDFQAIPVQSASGNGGKGGSSNSGSTSYDYKASFIFALGEGTLGGVVNVWASKSKKTFANSGLGFANGHLGQADWGYLDTKFPTAALGYSGLSYVNAMAYDLGSSAQLPNLSYEVTGLGANAITGLPDADPGAVVYDVLTSDLYGVGFPAARIASSFSLFTDYCLANGLVISPIFDTQSDAASQLNSIVQSCNSEFVWTGTTLTIVPYGDETITANGHTYTAPSAPLFSLTDDDFLYAGGQDPVQCSRTRPSDQMNCVRFEFLDRNRAYNANIVEASNQAAIEAYGLRGEQPEQMHHFCDSTAAKLAATLELQRQSVRNVYSFTLGWRYCLLDPMDIVEITDAGLGLTQQWVRILTLEENDNGDIAVTAEEYLGGTGAAPLYDFEPGSPYDVDYNIDPGDVNAPLIFEPPPVMLAARSVTAPQIMVGASGGANWGGCEVWLSLDNATYKRLGRITAPARSGTLSANLASHADPDTVHTLSVNLSSSGGVLHSGTQADADAFRTLCYVDGELIAYETATLTGTGLYNLTYLRRGVYGTGIEAHASGTEFCRLDEAIKSFNLPITPVSYVGQTLYLKFLSYNIYGGGQQELSDVSPYTYVLGGSGVFVIPPTGISFTVGAEQQGDGTWISFGVIAWTASQDPLFDQYEVQWRLHTGPGAWSSLRLGPDTTSHRISPIPANTAYDVQVRAVRTSGPFYSAWDQALDIASVGKTTAPPAPTSLTVIGGYRQIAIDWHASAENDIAWYEVWEFTSTGATPPGGATLIAQIAATHYVRPNLGLSDTRFYWIRGLDTSGNHSTYLGPGNATTNAVDGGDITGVIAAATVEGTSLANNIIDYSKMASGYGIAASVNTLPGPASPLRYPGSLVLLTTNAKLYRWDSVEGAWTVATDGGDITANSIVASSLVTGIITTAYLAAGAVTAEKLFIGDTTNLVLDDMFQDSNYWTLRNPGTSPVVVAYQNAAPIGSPNATTNLGALTSVQVFTSNIPASSGLNYGAATGFIPIKQKLNYRASCAAVCSGSGVNKNAQLFIQWFDASQTIISNSNADGPQAGGAYAPTDHGEDGNLFTSTNGSIVTNTGLAPTGACFAVIFLCVPGGNSAAETGSGWWFSHVRLERQSVGTLIEDGSITTGHIVTGGLDAGAGAIKAGSVTGDRMFANFIDSETFSTIPTGGGAFAEINGKSQTVTSHQNGPWFRINDGTHDRVIFGQLQSKWGLWINDASGNPFFEEYQLASGVVVTDHLAIGSATAPASFSLAASLSGAGNTSYMTALTGSVHLNAAGMLQVVAGFNQDFTSGAGAVWHLRLSVDGSVIYTTGGGAFANTPCIVWAGPVAAGLHTVLIEWAADTNAVMSEGTMGITGLIR